VNTASGDMRARATRRFAKKVNSKKNGIRNYLPFFYEFQDLLFEFVKDQHVKLLIQLIRKLKCDCFFTDAVCLNKNCKVKSVTKYKLKANISIDCKFGMREPGLSVAEKAKLLRSKARNNNKDRIHSCLQ
jgi:hypothetical protein